MKLKIFLVLLLAVVYYLVTFCVLSPGVCRYYADYYILYRRSFSIDEERAFNRIPLHKRAEYYRRYALRVSPDTIKIIGVTPEGESGLWSNGNTVKLSFIPVQVYSNLLLEFDVTAYLNSKNKNVDVDVYLSDQKVAEWNFEYGRKRPKTQIKIAKKYLKEGYSVDLTFKIDGIASPQSLGYGSETKKFGLILNSLKLLPYGD